MAQTYKKARAEAAVRDLVRHWLLVQEEMAQVKDPDTLRYVEGFYLNVVGYKVLCQPLFLIADITVLSERSGI